MGSTFGSRFRGGVLGVAVGDALGVPVEFLLRADIAANPVTEMRGFGTHRQPPGTWSDDTSLTLCLLEGLTEGRALKGIAELFLAWMTKGHWTPRGRVFDVGMATREAIFRIDDFEDPRDAGLRHERSNGNGSLMRTLPVALMRAGDTPEEVAALAHDISRLTHGHARSQMACGIYCELVRRLLHGEELLAAWNATRQWAAAFYQHTFPEEIRQFRGILRRTDAEWQSLPTDQISTTGYVIDTLDAALWCLLTTDNFRDCVLKAVNLGDDTDTTGAVAGGLAGVLYGTEGIPADWLDALARRDEIEELIAKALKKAHVP